MTNDAEKLRENLRALFKMAGGTTLAPNRWQLTNTIGAPFVVDLEAVASLMACDAIVSTMGNLGRCRDCNERIHWVRMASSGRMNPIQADGLSHFAGCPGAAKFRRKAVAPSAPTEE